jgi:hypothetical protein
VFMKPFDGGAGAASRRCGTRGNSTRATTPRGAPSCTCQKAVDYFEVFVRSWVSAAIISLSSCIFPHGKYQSRHGREAL